MLYSRARFPFCPIHSRVTDFVQGSQGDRKTWEKKRGGGGVISIIDRYEVTDQTYTYSNDRFH